jgi:NADH:ubiquinone oxidoreductase subunit E
MEITKNKDKFDKLAEFIESRKNDKGSLMPVMQAAQEIFGCLPLEVQNFIAESLNVPLTEVYGVSTFYSQFTLEGNGEHVVSVCMGTACYVKGAEKVLERLAIELKVQPGKTTPDGKFTLLQTRCLGCCGLAPVMTVDDEVFGRLAADDVPGILAKYKDK